MTIHHATVKRAAALGFTLSEQDGIAVGLWPERAIEIANKDPKLVIVGLQLAKRFRDEYPGMVVSLDEDADTGTIFHHDDPENVLGEYAVDSDLDAVFAEALENAQDEDLDPTKIGGEEPEEEEEESKGNVVAQRYKDEYRARGNPNNCGDWLAKTLEGAFLRPIVEGKKTMRFDVDAFTICLGLNDVPMSGKWAALPDSGQKGWEGRYRMNGRQALEKRVAASGRLFLRPGEEAIPVPADELAVIRAKHPSIEPEEVQQEEGGE